MKVRAFHAASRGTYGCPRIYRDLKEDGERVSRKRIARVMRENGLSGSPMRKFRRTTNSDHGRPVAKNVVGRDFSPSAPNRVWASDISYVRTWQGWLYVAVVIDLYSRRVVGWAVADHMRVELTLDALTMAIKARHASPGLVHHSDRGSQYASAAYQQTLDHHGITFSMSRRGDCWDNAVVESFFATLKKELIHRSAWPSRRMAADAIGDYIESFYNSRRRHSTLGYVSPIAFELASNPARLVA